MKVLVIGSGGREHALCWALSASSLVDALYAAPGNAGMAEEAQCVDIAADDIGAIGAFSKSNAIDLVVIGPEGPLVAGLADLLEADGIKAFGPSAAAARLEAPRVSPRTSARAMASPPLPTAALPRPARRLIISNEWAPPSSSRPTAWPPARG